MKNLFTLLFFFIASPLFSQTYNPKIEDSFIEEFLIQVINTKKVYWNEDSLVPKHIALVEQTAHWGKNSFYIADSLIPKEAEAAQSFYTNKYGIYNLEYTFKNSSLDSLLGKEEKQYLTSQINNSKKIKWKIKSSTFLAVIKNLKDKKYNRRYVYSLPVFTKDLSIGIIKKIVYWRSKDCMKDCGIGYFSETNHYYFRNPDNKWIYLGGGGAWE